VRTFFVKSDAVKKVYFWVAVKAFLWYDSSVLNEQ